MTKLNNIKEEVKKEANIVDVIEHYIKVDKSKSQYKAKCPFHDDHNPSLNINTTFNTYKCFACEASGDVFNFVLEYEKKYNGKTLGFIECIKKVADICSINIPETYFNQTSNQSKNYLSIYYEILNKAIEYTKYNLVNNDNKNPLNYLIKTRGLNEDILNYFDIGLVLDNNDLYKVLTAKGYNDKELRDINLINFSDKGKLYDTFYNRITFPIHDAKGNPIGFSARTISSNNDVKYLNTSKTSVNIYNKSKELYNLHRVLSNNNVNEYLYIVEGVMDVIALHMCGKTNVVSTLGKTLSQDQINLIKNKKYIPVIAYDADEAGIAGSKKACDLLLNNKIDFYVLYRNEGKDFDEILHEEGADTLNKILDKLLSPAQFIIEYHSRRLNLENYSDKKKFHEAVSQEYNKIEDKFIRNDLNKMTLDLCGVEILQIQNIKNTNVVVSNPIERKGPRERNGDSIRIAEEKIVYCMLKSQSAMKIYYDQLGQLDNSDLYEIALLVKEYYNKHSKMDITDFISDLNNNYVNVVNHLLNNYKRIHNVTQEFSSALILDYKVKKLERKKDELLFNSKYLSDDEIENELKKIDSIIVQIKKICNNNT